MTSQSPRIYLYKITFEEAPYYYYGSKKEKYFNEEYFGSPITNKWCWELYTPKKQILEIFPYTDEGYIKAQEVEKRLIKPVLNDKWCLNENVGGILSLKTAKIGGEKCRDEKIGIFSFTNQQLKENGMKSYIMKKGIHKFDLNQRVENSKKGGKKCRDEKKGIFSFGKEKLSEIGKKGSNNTNSQRWMCLETGFITNSGSLSRYQKAKGIDISKRKRIA